MADQLYSSSSLRGFGLKPFAKKKASNNNEKQRGRYYLGEEV